jgi:cation transport protein ChaC
VTAAAPLPAPCLAPIDGREGFWVFAYGSLMWRPGFAFAERRRARVEGWRRAFRLWSVRYRGTPEAPGLVLGLDAEAGARCEGVAYRVGPADGAATLAYLRERELVTYAYAERLAVATLDDGATVDALLYAIDRRHPQYAGALDLDRQAAIIAGAAGPAGSNRAYLEATAEHLAALGIADPEVESIVRRVAGSAAPLADMF